MSGKMFLDVPGQSPRKKRTAPAIPSPVSRSLSFDGPRSPNHRQHQQNQVFDYNNLSRSYDQKNLFSSAASCNRGPVTSHPMIARRAPPPYNGRRVVSSYGNSNSSLDSLEVHQLDISSSSLNSNEVSTPDIELSPEDDFALRSRLDIRKSKSDEEVIRKFREISEIDGVLKQESPPNEKKTRLKLDPSRFFGQKNPFHGAKSPRMKRKTVPMLDSPEGDENKRISAPPGSYEYSFQSVGTDLLDSPRSRKKPITLSKVGSHREVFLKEQTSFLTERQTSLIESMNIENGGFTEDPLNMTYPLSKGQLSVPKRKSRIKSPSPIRRSHSKADIITIPQDGELWFVISQLEELERNMDFEVQRIPQYDRYLSELMNETEQTHPDYDEISKTAEKVSNMVKERQVETMHAENEYKVESVQDRFPNDDLELNEKDKRVPKIQSRRRSAPSAVLLKTLSSKNKSNQQSSDRPLPFLPDELPTKPQSTHRTYLLESPVRMSEGDQTFDRYMFLFNDLLLVAKKKSPTAFKLKNKIRLSEVWLAHAIDEVSQSSCPLERSFVIGWPTTNFVATFDTTEMRDLWWAKLRSQISIEKRREEPKAIQLKILNRDMQAYASMKTIDVYSGQEANDVIKTCVEQFEIADADLKDYQIWVCSGKDPPNSAYPLIGHEDIYSIKMNHVRDAIKHKGDIFILPCDTDFGSETVPREYQVEFFLKRKGMGCPYFDDGKKKGSKKSPIITLFNRPKAARRESSVPGTSPGKFFGQRLADVSADDEPPKPIMDLLCKLFIHGPFTQGIFRRSANLRMVRELHEAIDTESDIMVDDIPILVIGDTIKSFLREMPGCIFGDDLYDKFLATNAMADPDRADELKRLVENLPRCNQKLLRHLFCVLHHIHLKSQENQMTAYNLAICIGPSLLKTPGKSEDSVPTSPVDTQRESSVVEFMIEHFELIFGHEALYVFGDIRPRQDSSTDSDSLQSSHGRLETNVVLRREDSSSDSLNHDLDSSEMESSPRMGKSHLSPTNLSRDSGLTLSDSQLYDDDVDDASKYEIGITSQLQRQKRRVSDPANSNTALGGGCQIDTSRLYAKMAVPGNGMLTSNIGQQVDRSRSSPQHQVSLRSQQQAKRQQADSLKAVKEGAVTDFASSDDMGYLKKSASGARLFFDEEYVSTQGPSQSKDSAVQSPPPHSQRPVSPHTYRRMWLTEAMENAPTKSSPDPRSSSPHRQAIQARLSAGVLDDRRRGRAGMSQSAPVTPDQLSPAHRALSPSRSMATSPAHHAGHAPKPHLVVTARRVFEQHFEERRRQQDANQSSSDEERPRRDSRRKLLPHPNVKTMVASLEKSNSDSDVLNRVETSPRHRPDKPPSYQEAIYRQNMLKQSDEHISRHRDRLVTRCLSDHHTTQPQDTLAPSQPQPGTNIRRSHSEKDRTGRSESRVKADSEQTSSSRGLERSHGKRGVFYIASTRSDEPAKTSSRLTPAKDNPNRYSTGAILDSVAPRDYTDSRSSLSPPPRTPVHRTNSDVVRTSSRDSETYRSSRDSETYRTESRKWSPTDNVNYSSEEYFV